tara:strand:+ start:329 stop:508 length:180 start_codon:yes stop_codon:yes gene_type:complete
MNLHQNHQYYHFHLHNQDRKVLHNLRQQKLQLKILNLNLEHPVVVNHHHRVLLHHRHLL